MGKSGKHVAKMTSVPRTEHEAAAWRKAAAKVGAPNLCVWIRALLNAECARMGVRVGETLDGDEDT